MFGFNYYTPTKVVFGKETELKAAELIREFGEKLVGKYWDRPFPLLLKLIDARDKLSVQVHPDDEYAAAHEHGKLGKNEAWLILDAQEGSELVYGLQTGTTLRELKEACENGKAVENRKSVPKLFHTKYPDLTPTFSIFQQSAYP